MFERNVYDEYKLYCERRFRFGEYEGFTARNNHYFLVCVDDIEDDELMEMVKMGNHLSTYGDYQVALYVPTSNQALTAFIAGQNCVLFRLPPYFPQRNKRRIRIGYELARLHTLGKHYQRNSKTTGGWSQFWINRLTQLELLYTDLAKQKRKYVFDQSFMLSFPYYLGRTETAIQYYVDNSIDFRQQLEAAPKTICHYRFSSNTWLHVGEGIGQIVKNPVQFTFDYASRDLAEWLRSTIENEDEPLQAITSFIHDYETVEEISPLAWRQMYARLLFPINYFEIVEGYYRSVDDEEAEEYIDKLFAQFQKEIKTEAVLRNFYNNIVPTHVHKYFPKVEWLS